MSKFTKYTEKPTAIEAIFWDGTLEGATDILREVPHSTIYMDGTGGTPTLAVGNQSEAGPAYVFLDGFTWRLRGAESFTHHYTPATDAAGNVERPGLRVIDRRGDVFEYPAADGAEVEGSLLNVVDSDGRTLAIFRDWDHAERMESKS